MLTYWIKVEMREVSDALCAENSIFKKTMAYLLWKNTSTQCHEIVKERREEGWEETHRQG